jgi:hypothetical protein
MIQVVASSGDQANKKPTAVFGSGLFFKIVLDELKPHRRAAQQQHVR